MSEKQNGAGTEASLDLDAMLSREMSGAGAGGLSWFQLRAVALCALASLISALSTNEYVFTTGRIATRCLIPECESTATSSDFTPDWIVNAIPSSGSGFDNCHRFANTTAGLYEHVDTCPASLFDPNEVIDCEEYVYQNDHTVVYTLGLACDEWRRSLLGSARTFGALLSLPLGGAISDRWGRRTALVIVCFNTAWIGLLRVAASTYTAYFLTVFAEATLGAGAILAICYVLGLEQVPANYRVRTGTSINILAAVGQVTLGSLAWALPYWKHLTLILYVPQLLTLSFYWIVPESVRWCLSKGRYAEAEAILRKIAKSKGKELSEKTLLELKQAAEYEQLKEAEMKKEPWLVVLVFQHKPMLFRILSLVVCWITMVLTYFGLSVNAVHISGNMYLNFLFVAMVDIPAFLTARLLLDRLGRKPLLTAGYWVCACCQIAYTLMPKDMYGLSLSVYLVGKFCIAMVGTSIYVYTSELYPTQYRHRLFGFTSMTGRLGSIVAPLTPALGTMIWQQLPFVLFAGMALMSGVLILLGPETRGCPLPTTMEEACRIGAQRKTPTTAA